MVQMTKNLAFTLFLLYTLSILEVTDELGRQAPHRRDEVARRRRQIQTKLVQAMAELVSLTDEIALGCDSCQANYEN